VYGPVRTVVWQGSAGNRRPYADQQALSLKPPWDGGFASPKKPPGPVSAEEVANIRIRLA